MSAADIIIYAIVAVLVVFIVRHIYKSVKSGKSSCGCGCGSCPVADRCDTMHQEETK